MKFLIILALIGLSSARVLQLRHKRQLEVEGDNGGVNPSNDVVVIKDVNNDNGPSYQLIPIDPNTGMAMGGSGDAGNTDVVDLDINEDDGTFRLGGRIPSLHDHFHRTNFADMFRAIQERFDEMARRMAASFGQGIDGVHIHGPGCGHCDETDGNSNSTDENGQESGTSVATLPENYNNTKTEIITIHGRQFLKKTTVIKKGGPGTSIFISSTTYEPINDSDNADNGNEETLKPAGSGNDRGSSVVPSSSTPSTPIVPNQPQPEGEGGQSAPGSSSTSTTTESGLEREELTSPARDPV